MGWSVSKKTGVQKKINKLPKGVQDICNLLMKEIEVSGPVRGAWPNYGKLTGGRHHCHLKKGNPTYVAVWRVIDQKAKKIEVEYVGTHEGAPY